MNKKHQNGKLQIYVSCIATLLVFGLINGLALAEFLDRVNDDKGVVGHVDQKDIESGFWTQKQLFEAGKRLFVNQFTLLDGVGRPGSTGDPSPTRRPLEQRQRFIRTAGPDANSCVACHNQPTLGGAGSFTTNVFAGLGSRNPTFLSIDPTFSSERGTPEVYGSGLIELLAREMTEDLHKLRDKAKENALATGDKVRVQLMTKGVSFGELTARPDGSLELSAIEGVDRDLVVRPWGQKGTVTSLRTFTVNALNLHHGMQARERFGFHLTGTADFDRDGVTDELTEGDITALVAFQVMLNMPGRVYPDGSDARQRIDKGEVHFNSIGCSGCHMPSLPLRSAIYTEPGPYNLEGTLRDNETEKVLTVDLETDTESPRVLRDSDGHLLVPLFSDLKRHRVSDDEKPHFGNEVLVEGLVPTDVFITKRLWAVGNTGPYGHRGDLTTLEAAILNHGGEASDSRIAYESLATDKQKMIIEFLRSLRGVRAGSPYNAIEKPSDNLPYQVSAAKR